MKEIIYSLFTVAIFLFQILLLHFCRTQESDDCKSFYFLHIYQHCLLREYSLVYYKYLQKWKTTRRKPVLLMHKNTFMKASSHNVLHVRTLLTETKLFCVVKLKCRSSNNNELKESRL